MFHLMLSSFSERVFVLESFYLSREHGQIPSGILVLWRQWDKWTVSWWDQSDISMIQFVFFLSLYLSHSLTRSLSLSLSLKSLSDLSLWSRSLSLSLEELVGAMYVKYGTYTLIGDFPGNRLRERSWKTRKNWIFSWLTCQIWTLG